MKTVDDARELAETMIVIGRNLGREVNAMISNMNQPLGRSIGNALEVKEAYLTLKNQGPKDLEELCTVASGYMLFQSGISESPEKGRELAEEVLKTGAAYETFLKWIEAQGGDISVFDDIEGFTKSKYSYDLKSDSDGVLHDLKALELGLVSMHLGAGRQTKEDILDYKAGIELKKDVGDSVNVGDVLATLYSDSPIKSETISDAKLCFVFGKNEITKPSLIADIF